MTARTALLLSTLALGCASPAEKPPVVTAVIAPGQAPTSTTASAGRVLKQRKCRVESTRRESGADARWTIDLTVGDDAAGDAIELLQKASDGTQITIERSYDAAHRFMSERRRSKGPTEDWRTTTTWERDASGQVKRAERWEENMGLPSARKPAHVVSVVVERHASGRWLRRESRLYDVVFRRETREYDGAGRVTKQRTDTAATEAGPAGSIVKRFAYVAGSPRAKTETVEEMIPGEEPKPQAETVYDARGLATSIHIWVHGDADEGLWLGDYDAAGRLLSRTRGDGAKETYTYSGDCPADARALMAAPNSADE